MKADREWAGVGRRCIPAGKNGSINGSMTFTPPLSGAFSCPPGQVPVLGKVTYDNVGVEDEDYNIYEDFGGPFSRVMVPF